jgi:hypothetical protein
MLQLNAPPAYGNDNVVVQVHSLLYRGPEVTAHQILAIDSGNWTNPNDPNHWTAIGTVADCSVGGEAAAFAGFSHGGVIEYRIYVIHHPDGLPYAVYVIGQSGIDDQSMLDAKRLMGSWGWGV